MKKQNNQTINIYFHSTPAYEVRYEELDGKDFMVVPVVMMMEGVHVGSVGPVLHTAEELGKIPETWNGIPVTVTHPSINGQYVSANSPEVLSTFSIGKVFHAHMVDEKLHAEAWLEVDKATQHSPELVEKINNGEIIEVSVGTYSDSISQKGMFNDEMFEAIAVNYRPDHLALLPDDVGACSIKDGCGLRVNKYGGTKMEFIVNEQNAEQVLKEISKKGLIVNATGYNELQSKAMDAINNLDSDTTYHYLVEMFDTFLVYKSNTYVSGIRSGRYYKQSYQENAAGEINLLGEAVQVKRVVDYPTVIQNNEVSRTKFNNNQKKGEMSDCKPCIKAAVDTLINNKATSWSENDREFLEGLTENQLEKFNPVVIEKTIEVNKTSAAPKTTEEYLATIPKEIREQVETGLRVHSEQKTAMVAAIMANNENVWTKEELEATPFATLQKIQMTVNANKKVVEEETVNYMAFGSTPEVVVNKSGNVEVMAPIGVTFKTN